MFPACPGPWYCGVGRIRRTVYSRWPPSLDSQARRNPPASAGYAPPDDDVQPNPISPGGANPPYVLAAGMSAPHFRIAKNLLDCRARTTTFHAGIDSGYPTRRRGPEHSSGAPETPKANTDRAGRTGRQLRGPGIETLHGFGAGRDRSIDARTRMTRTRHRRREGCASRVAV
jgi:hypothetical protein